MSLDAKPLWITSAGVIMPVIITLIIWGISVERRSTAQNEQIKSIQVEIHRLSDRIDAMK